MVRLDEKARDEMHHEYREAKRQQVLENPKVFDGWMWRAACDGQTCELCWEKHGLTYPAEIPMVSHPGCRCALVPNPRSFADILGVPIPDPLAEIRARDRLLRYPHLEGPGDTNA